MRAAALLALLGLLAGAAAHPYYHIGCFHPTRGQADHADPVPDAIGTSFSLVDAAGKAVAGYCPGKSYGVKVTFAQPRQGMMTTSMGAFQGGLDSWWVGHHQHAAQPGARRPSAAHAVLCCEASGAPAADPLRAPD
jgi:hypothetical protein